MHFIFSDPINKKIISDKSVLSIFSIALIFIALLHHAFFCFIYTNFFSINSSVLIVTELTLLAITFAFFVRRTSLYYILILIFIISNFLILVVFQQYFDPKNLRNFIIPVLMIWLGSQYDHRISVDLLVKWMGYIVLFFGLFELFFSDTFQSIFNILNFQISIGSASESALEYADGNFSANGTRYGGRNLLSFLGEHRVSSVFLETVSTSNFCTFLAAWGLSKKRVIDGLQFLFLAILIAMLADSRFGVTLITVMILIRFALNKKILKIFAYLSPLIFILICLYFGLEFKVFLDDFKTRLGTTGYYILNFKLLEFFGMSDNHYAQLLDQGYARLFHFNGIILMVILWLSFCSLKVKENAEIFKYLVAVIISANLAISGGSIFAFKFAAIMWFILGTQLHYDNKNTK